MKYNVNEVRCILKTEYIGLDEVIDKLVDYVETYLKVKDNLVKPFVVNLWGMTGYGKTSLVNRLIELMGLDAYEYCVSDVNDREKGYYGFFEDLADFSTCKNKCMVIDEFHHMRSRDEFGGDNELTRSARTIWDILDSGVFLLEDKSYEARHAIKSIIECLKIIKELKENYSVTVKGINCIEVTSSEKNIKLLDKKIEYLLIEIHEAYTETNRGKNNKHVLKLVLRNLFFKLILLSLEGEDLNKKIDKLSERYNSIESVLNFYEGLIKDNKDFYKINLKNMLVFNLGNLDGIYGFSDEHNLDLSPDDCKDIASDITYSDVNRCLSRMFRAEHVSRLGTSHIIYPIYSSGELDQIINKYLSNRITSISDQNTQYIIKDSVIEYIRVKRTYITLGVRNIINTVEDLVVSIVSYVGKHNISGTVVVDYCFNEGDILINGQKTGIDKKVRADDKVQKALISVHETGHFLSYYLLNKLIPIKVSCTSDTYGVNGYMLKKHKDMKSYDNFYMLKKEIMVLLSGFMAERVIFNSSMVSSGSSSDIEKATKQLSFFLRDCGYYLTEEGLTNMDYIAPLSSNVGILKEDGKYGTEDNSIDRKVFLVLNKFYQELYSYFNEPSFKSLLIDVSKELYKQGSFNTDKMEEIVKTIPEDILENWGFNEVEENYYDKLFGE